MSKTSENAPSTDASSIHQLIDGTDVPMSEVLNMCAYLGKQLQGIPQAHRKLAVARLRNKADDCRKEGLTLGLLMLTVVAESWEDFGS